MVTYLINSKFELVPQCHLVGNITFEPIWF